ncbi:hypothetical protein BGZ96_005053 [Linnemannia gamsii]|uniref:Uncharacterized protein n=1 Tax=Linnemannia gamsii TaxID=64522 RepID=A0ABQ7K5Z1_9FUNG|nr:hypothetical protein BGZ96_005053 [Linnemannia gamsii]
MGKKTATATVNQKQNCACGRHAMGDKEACRFCTNVVCDSCREEYCCGPICEKCCDDTAALMKCDTCEAPVCAKCIVVTKGAREGNQCKKCKAGLPISAGAHPVEATV